MTRKKFIKSLMAWGCSRNQAVETAEFVRKESFLTYEQFFKLYRERIQEAVIREFENWVLYGADPAKKQYLMGVDLAQEPDRVYEGTKRLKETIIREFGRSYE